jgi:hypothetical protein
MEILLVLAVLTLVAAVAWPELQKPFASRRLHWAADTVRTQWCQARCEAMKSGHVYAFRYVVRGDRFRTEAEADTGWMSAAGPETASSATGAAEGHSPASETVFLPVETGTLPEGVTFMPGEPAASEPPATPGAENEAQESAGEGWSDPILFYPDGTTSDATLVLAGQHRLAIEMMLRGLTGTVTTGDVASLVE